jgi:hypothetical protein
MPPSIHAALALLALASPAALAQVAVPPTQTVQQLAPQLVAFAGSPTNFQSLVNGLSQGTPVQLVSVLPGGATQVVSFTPARSMSPLEVAQILELSRQQLIGLGIASPTAEQLGVALIGGLVPTALGSAPLPGTVNPRNNPPSPAAQMQSAASGASAAVSSVSAGGVSVQLFAPASPPLVPGASTLPPIVTPNTVPGAAAAATPPAPERTPTTTPAPQKAPLAPNPRH